MKALIAGTAALVVACSPAPRSQTYFESHPEEAGRVVAQCAAGAAGGQECVNALAAEKRARDAARRDLFRQAL